MAIKRIWRGRITPDDADACEALLKAHVLPGIEAKAIPGYRGIEVLRQDMGPEVGFSTVMEVDALDDVVAFQGADRTRAYVPERAQAALSRRDRTSRHYEVREARRHG